MEMYQVRYFLAAARTLNFTRAAQECNVSQPSLTRAIQKLEEEFGGQLFRRERSLTHLTELGRQMVPHLQRTYDAAQAAKLLAKGIARQVHAPVTLGVAGTVSDPLGAALAQVADGLPGFQLSLVKADAASVMQSLFKGDIDAAVIPEPPDPPERLDTLVLAHQQFCLITSTRCGPLVDGTVGLQDLARLEWIDGDAHVTAAFLALCSEAGFEPRMRHSANVEGDLIDLVANGLGCAWVPQGLHLPDRVRQIVVDGVSLSRTTVFATVAGRKRSVATDALVRAIRARAWG